MTTRSERSKIGGFRLTPQITGCTCTNGKNRKDLDIDAVSALKKYVQENGPVKPEIEGTIVAI